MQANGLNNKPTLNPETIGMRKPRPTCSSKNQKDFMKKKHLAALLGLTLDNNKKEGSMPRTTEVPMSLGNLESNRNAGNTNIHWTSMTTITPSE